MEREVRSAVWWSTLRIGAIALIVLLVALGVAFTTTIPFFVRLFTQPHPMSADEVLQHKPTGAPVYFAQIQGTQMLDSGYEYVASRYGIETSVKYYGLLRVGGKLMLVQSHSPIDESRTEYTGTLTSIPGEVQSNVIVGLMRQQSSLRNAFVYVMLDTLDFEWNWTWYLGAAVLILVMLGAGVGLLSAFTLFRNPTSHPVLKNLRRFGDLSQTTEQIKGDLDLHGTEIGPLRFGNQWILKSDSFDAMRFEDVVWAYQTHETARAKRGNLSVDYGHALVICDRFGVVVKVPVDEINYERVILLLREHAPWAIYDDSASLQGAWLSGRQTFIDAVMQRKEQGITEGVAPLDKVFNGFKSLGRL